LHAHTRGSPVHPDPRHPRSAAVGAVGAAALHHAPDLREASHKFELMNARLWERRTGGEGGEGGGRVAAGNFLKNQINTNVQISH
jgi:hypothetical protein